MAETTRFGRRITQVVEMGDRNVLLPRRYEDVLDRVNELIEARSNTLPALMRTAQMMDGGERAVAALLAGHHDHKLKDMPIANYMRDAAEAFAGRLAAIPDLRVDPPSTGRASDENETRTRSAEKRARIVASYDDDLADGVAERIPMMARWVPGAGYAVWTIRPIMVNGFPYPRSELRNPLDTALAQWTPVTRPEDCGFVYTKPVKQLVHEYPEHAHRLSRNDEASGMSGAVLLDRHRDGLGVTVVEYHDRNGTWWLVPDKQLLLDFVENPLESGPSFEAFTKFNYNRLRGEYDDMIGPMISMARLHILSELAIRKDVAQPTNLFTGPGGALSGPYKQGFNKVNIFDPNARVEIPRGSAQFQAWQQLDRLERQMRIEGQAPLQDSGESPMSFVTGRGMNALTERVERTVREYQRVFKAGLQRLDAKRLEYDERSWPDISKPMQGVRQGAAFSETYKPSTHIRGNFRTRREYGAMASVDEAVRLNGLALMQQLGWTSAKWSRTQLDELGIPDTQMEEQIRHERAEEAFQQMLLMAVNNPEHPEHMRALQLVVESLPQGRTRDLAEKWLTERGEELAEAEEAMLGMGQPTPAPQDVLAALAGGGGAGPDPVTLARVTQGGEAQGGTQLVARGARGEG